MVYGLNTILVGAVVGAYLVFDLLWHKIDHSKEKHDIIMNTIMFYGDWVKLAQLIKS